MTLPGHVPPYASGVYDTRHWRKRVHRSGRTLSIYLPYQLCREVGIEKDTEVLVYLIGRAIVLQRADEPHFTPLVASAALVEGEQL